jgi:hypothetical protein
VFGLMARASSLARPAGTEKLGVATDFTFYLVDTGQWEGRDHHVRLAWPGA